MSIQVEGNGNRVAGHTYNENVTLTLTPEQLKQLELCKCPACEQRLLGPGERTCNACRAAAHARRMEELNARRWTMAGRFFFFLLVVWGLFITVEQKATGQVAVAGERFWELGMGAFGACLLSVGAWLWAREWWWRNGPDFMDAMGRRIRRMLGL